MAENNPNPTPDPLSIIVYPKAIPESIRLYHGFAEQGRHDKRIRNYVVFELTEAEAAKSPLLRDAKALWLIYRKEEDK